jgi:hypothetical protein
MDGTDGPLPGRDPLGHALRSEPQPPVDDIDWSALHARILHAAGPTLAGLAAAGHAAIRAHGAAERRPGGIWLPLAGWSPFGIPLATAAAVLLLIGAALAGTRAPADRGTDGDALRTIEEELASGLGPGAGALIAGTGSYYLLDAMLLYGDEER